MDPDWLWRGMIGPEVPIDEGCLVAEYLNHEASPEASLALARVPRGVRTRLHALDGTLERYIVLSGRGRVEIAGETAELGPGDVVVIGAGVAQRIEAVGDEDLRFFCLCTPRFRPVAYRDLEENAPKPSHSSD